VSEALTPTLSQCGRGSTGEKIVKCKFCKEKAMLHRKARGTYTLVEVEMVYVTEERAGKPIITEDGETIQKARVGDVGYVPHYLKCKGGR